MNKRDELKLKIQECEKDQKELNKLKQNIEFQKLERINEINELLKENCEIEGEIANSKENLSRCLRQIEEISSKFQNKLEQLKNMEIEAQSNTTGFQDSIKIDVDMSEEQEYLCLFNQRIYDLIITIHKNVAGSSIENTNKLDSTMTSTIEKLQSTNDELNCSLSSINHNIKKISEELDTSKIQIFYVKSQISRLIIGFMIAFIIKMVLL